MCVLQVVDGTLICVTLPRCCAQSSASVVKLIARFGCEVFASYGMSECCGKISMSILDHTSLHPAEAVRRVCTSGRPFHLVDIRLLDSDGGDVEDGGAGEAVCRGSALFRDGYRNDITATNDAVFHGWFRTGDIASREGESNYISVVSVRSSYCAFNGQLTLMAVFRRIVFYTCFCIAILGSDLLRCNVKKSR
jgi:acyl-CoA synthetase (AMP-forming)/AMP-acid ligase II